MKKDMAKELNKYKDSVFILTKSGELRKIFIDTLSDYDHFKYELHHYIPYNRYIRNPEWYAERGINQKLILITKSCHEQVELRAFTGNMTDEEFERYYKISRWKLIFNRKHSEY